MGDWELTEETFNIFLSWLDPDRESAGRKFEAIRRRLLVVFDSRGCPHSEELVDETFLRFIRRLPAMLETFTGNDPIPYLLVTAHRLHLDYIEKQFLPLPVNLSDELPAGAESVEAERLDACLEDCLGKLEPGDRTLALDYYRKDKQAKIEFRKEMARRLGMTTNALRIKVHHLRNTLRECLEECLKLGLSEMK